MKKPTLVFSSMVTPLKFPRSIYSSWITPSNNQTLAIGDTGGDTEQMVSSSLIIFLFIQNISSLQPSISPQPSSPPNILALTATYFILNFLAATQDVAVDG